MTVILIAIAGLSYRVGGDTFRYSEKFASLPDIYDFGDFDFESSRYGIGYLLFNAIARTLSDDFTVMHCGIAIFVNTSFIVFFYRNTSKIFSGLLFYFILCFIPMNFEVLREACAVATFLIAWKYFYTHKWLKYYLCATIAVLFHPSAAITFIVPLFTLRIFTFLFSFRWWSIITIICIYLIGIFLSIKFFDLIRLASIATIDNYADAYADSKFSEGLNFSVLGMLAFFVQGILYPYVVLWLISTNRVSEQNFKSGTYKNSLVVLIFCYIYFSCFSSSIIILNRFNNYFIPFMILGCIDVVFHHIEICKKKYKLSYGFWICVIFPYLFVTIYGYFKPYGDTDILVLRRYYPYYSVLNPKMDKERERLIHYIYN